MNYPDPPGWSEIRAMLEAVLPKGAGPFLLTSWAVRDRAGEPPALVKLSWRCELPGVGEHRIYEGLRHVETRRNAKKLVSFVSRSVTYVEYPSYAEGEWIAEEE